MPRCPRRRWQGTGGPPGSVRACRAGWHRPSASNLARMVPTGSGRSSAGRARVSGVHTGTTRPAAPAPCLFRGAGGRCRGLRPGRADLHPVHPPDGPGRLAGPRLARRVRRSGPGADRPDDLRRGVPLGRRAAAAADAEQRRSDAHGPRHRASRSNGSCPGILRGEVHFSIGYTEPSAGTDLASLRTRAVRDGDEYVINGQKLYTSAIQYADYVWLAARTDPDAPKHKGLSVFIVPVDTPGFHWTPLPHHRRRHHQLDLLRGRPGAGRRTWSARRTRAGS